MLTVFVVEIPIMMGLSSEMSFSVPWDTFCPSLSATTVMSPSAMSYSLARADIGRLVASTRAAMPERMRLCFMEVGLLPVFGIICSSLYVRTGYKSVLAKQVVFVKDFLRS